MYYQVYLDVLLITNFCMNYFLLSLVKRWIPCNATWWSIPIGAFLGAAGGCVLLLLPGFGAFYKVLIAYTILSTGIVWIGLRLRSFAIIIQAAMSLYIGTFLFGGIVKFAIRIYPTFFGDDIRLMSVLIVAAISSFLLGRILDQKKRTDKQVMYPVWIESNQQRYEMVGIMDTGNSLCEPFSKKPVSVVECACFKNEDIEKLGRFCVIPYHSVGKETGILEGYQVDKLTIVMPTRKIERKEVIVAVSKEAVSSTGVYQMLLHPALLEDS